MEDGFRRFKSGTSMQGIRIYLGRGAPTRWWLPIHRPIPLSAVSNASGFGVKNAPTSIGRISFNLAVTTAHGANKSACYTVAMHDWRACTPGSETWCPSLHLVFPGRLGAVSRAEGFQPMSAYHGVGIYALMPQRDTVTLCAGWYTPKQLARGG